MSNTWNDFDLLTDKTQIRVAMIMAHVGTESLCQDSNNRQFRVPGTDYDVGTAVYIQNGIIVSESAGLIPGGTHYV